MRPRKLHFPDQALPPLETFRKQTQEARLFRRAPAVREVVQGHRLQTVSDSLPLTSSALRQWGQRVAHQGLQGLMDRPRPGRPPTVTGELAHHLDRLVAHDPLQHGSSHSPWSCQALATGRVRQPRVHRSRESVRDVLKQRRPLQPAHGPAHAQTR
jgi:transposase